MTHSDTIIEMNNVSVRYESNQNSVQAIEKVNMEIQKGEFVCLVGPSGCGKKYIVKDDCWLPATNRRRSTHAR